MNLVLNAIQFANERHVGQVRRGTGVPYITHPLAVSYLVAAYKRSKRLDILLTASVLHDVLEDTDATFADIVEQFGPWVASLVLEMTDDETEIARIGKLNYQKKKLAGVSSYALVIKLADRMHNISDNPTQSTLRDTLNLLQHLRKVRKLTRTHTRMACDIEHLVAGKLRASAIP